MLTRNMPTSLIIFAPGVRNIALYAKNIISNHEINITSIKPNFVLESAVTNRLLYKVPINSVLLLTSPIESLLYLIKSSVIMV